MNWEMTAVERARLCRAMHGNGGTGEGSTADGSEGSVRDSWRQLGADGLEAEELLTSGRVHVAPVAMGAEEGRDTWGKGMSATHVQRTMGLLGNENVLQREPGDLVAWLVNPAGSMRPYSRAGRWEPKCRLPTAAALIDSGVADIVVLPEAHVDGEAARAAGKYVALECNAGTRVLAAPTSRPAMVMELSMDAEPVKVSTHSGILVLLSPGVAERIEGTPTHRHFVAGRLLHVRLRD